MSTIPIGRMNKRITLQYKTLVSDGMGSFTASWVDIATVWAAIIPVSTKERMMADQVSGEITHRIRTRYRRNIRASWRIKFGNRYFNINGPPINPNERNQWLDILVKEAG